MAEVPKILHLYWGGEPMSWLQLQTVTTFHNLNKDWEINLYYSEYNPKLKQSFIPDYNGQDYFSVLMNSPEFKYVNKINISCFENIARKNVNSIHRSDILRYYLLYKFGGVWSDFDVLWIKPIGSLDFIKEKESFDSTICIYNGKDPSGRDFYHHNIGVIIANVKTKLYERVFDYAMVIEGAENHQEFGVRLMNNCFGEIDYLISISRDIIVVPYKTFYPYGIHDGMYKLYIDNDISNITDRTVCLHWFNGHELSKQYVNNEISKDCSMTSILKKLELIS